jgi:hypothetical protein
VVCFAGLGVLLARLDLLRLPMLEEFLSGSVFDLYKIASQFWMSSSKHRVKDKREYSQISHFQKKFQSFG